MSENRCLTVLEVLVHLSGTLPDKYLLGSRHSRGKLPVAAAQSILGERNYVLNPLHSDFARIQFAQPETFRFDLSRGKRR
jgi:hypothetical protein